MERIIAGKGADPRPEDGHVDIANELVEQLCRVNLTAYESRVLWFIFRKVNGWHKERDRISYSQFEKGTRLKRWHIARTLKKLQDRNMITVTPLGNSMEYSFQNDYTQWQIQKLPIEVTNKSLPRRAESLPNKVMKSLPNEVNTKEKKETKQKKGDDDYISLNTIGDGEDEDDGVAKEITLKGGEVVSAATLWGRVLPHLRDNVPSSNYNSWRNDTEGLAFVDNKCFVIGVGAYHLEEEIIRFKPLIEKAVLDVTGLPLKVEASY